MTTCPAVLVIAATETDPEVPWPCEWSRHWWQVWKTHPPFHQSWVHTWTNHPAGRAR